MNYIRTIYFLIFSSFYQKYKKSIYMYNIINKYIYINLNYTNYTIQLR